MCVYVTLSVKSILKSQNLILKNLLLGFHREGHTHIIYIYIYLDDLQLAHVVCILKTSDLVITN